MKKIVFASDGKNIPKGAFEFIKELNQEGPLLLAGAFLHAVNFEILLPGLFAMSPSPVMEFVEDEKLQYSNTVRQFREMCEKSQVEFTVHEESESWNIDDLAKETRFADLMVMSSELFCTDLNSNEPNTFMQEAIRRAECPVMVFPESYKAFNKLLIAYDGKSDSMFAIKEFCNLFPAYTSMPTKIIYAKNEDKDEMPDMVLLEEFAGRHFNNLDFEKKYFRGKDFFEMIDTAYAGALIICGSFGRKGLSNLFRKSFAEDAIHDHNYPLFIAHR